MIVLLAACAAPTDDSVAPFQWAETLDPTAYHLLMTATPGEGISAPAIVETTLGGTVTWSLTLPDGAGAMGAVRRADGSTVYARSNLPPDFTSAVEAVAADGTQLWSWSDIFIAHLGFAHGVVMRADGTFLAGDATGGRVVAFDEAGSTLWTLDLVEDDASWSPNGLALAGDALAVTMLTRSGGRGADRVAVYDLGADSATERWHAEATTGTAGTWPHGPRWAEDGSLTLAQAALGTIEGWSAEGTRSWSVPDAPWLAFPRDASALPDGTWLIADGGLEVVRVGDPRGRFVVLEGWSVPGVYSVAVLDCAIDVCLTSD